MSEIDWGNVAVQAVVFAFLFTGLRVFWPQKSATKDGMKRRFFCYFCLRPSTGVYGYETDGCGRDVSCCDKHTWDAQALAQGSAHLLATERAVGRKKVAEGDVRWLKEP